VNRLTEIVISDCGVTVQKLAELYMNKETVKLIFNRALNMKTFCAKIIPINLSGEEKFAHDFW